MKIPILFSAKHFDVFFRMGQNWPLEVAMVHLADQEEFRVPNRRDLAFTLYLLTETARGDQPFTVGTFLVLMGALSSTDLPIEVCVIFAGLASVAVGAAIWVFWLEEKCKTLGAEVDFILRANPVLCSDMGELSASDPDIYEASRQFVPGLP